jgi:hypothetical protein
MKHRASSTGLGRLAGWALPILAGLVLAPAARASCGDYVSTRLSPDGMTSSGHALPADQPPPAVPEPLKPCSGPHCSQAPAAPLDPVRMTPPQTSQEWGCVAGEFLLAPHDPTALLTEQQFPRPTRLPSGIFHPPRFAP